MALFRLKLDKLVGFCSFDSLDVAVLSVELNIKYRADS